MKFYNKLLKLTAALAVTATTSLPSMGAFAGNSSIGGVPEAPFRSISFVVRHDAGFSPHPVNQTITVQLDGKVVAQTTELGGAVIWKKTIAVLARSVLLNMQVKAFEIQGPLVDQQAGEPMCTDAPSTSYSFVVANSAPTTFYQRSGCHEFQSEDGAANELKNVLQGLDSLAGIAAE